MDQINKMLDLIEAQTGLKLTLCNHFTGLRSNGEKPYFNVIVRDRVCQSKEFAKLVRFSNSTELITVEPNGVNRIAIYPNIDKLNF